MKRVANFIGFIISQEDYEKANVELIAWIKKKTSNLIFQKPEIDYFKLEKPLKQKARIEINALFFSININSRIYQNYAAPEGKTLNDLELEWDKLEIAEKGALKKELKRKLDLDVDKKRQVETLIQDFDKGTSEFYDWIQQTRKNINGFISVGKTVEKQQNYIQIQSQLVKDNFKNFKAIEELSIKLKNVSIYDTEYSILSLAQSYDHLDQYGMLIQKSLEQQIKAHNKSGVSEDVLREFSLIFKHFDEKRTCKLDHDEFKSCLIALGKVIPKGRDRGFEKILDKADPNRDGHISLENYFAYLISLETDYISSMADLTDAFKELADYKPYITKAELEAVSLFYRIYFCYAVFSFFFRICQRNLQIIARVNCNHIKINLEI